MLWAPLIAGLGWIFGQALSAIAGQVQRVEIGLLLLAVLVAAIWWLVIRRRDQRDQSPR
jgi:membrane protein DedA with SNARE-associated domain